MPQLIVRYDPVQIPAAALKEIGQRVRPLVALAASTDAVKLTENDIEWIPRAHEPGTIAPMVAIELRTIGFPERKKRLDEMHIRALRTEMLYKAGLNEYVEPGQPLIWVQFIDPDGVHV